MATKPFVVAAVFSLFFCQSDFVLADFKVVTSSPAPSAPSINYGAPLAATKPLAGSVSTFARSKPVITEVGSRNQLAGYKTPSISSFGSTLGSILGAIIPSELQVQISRDTNVGQPIKIEIGSGTPWYKALNQALSSTNNFAIINWNSNTVTIGANSTRDLNSIAKKPDKEVTGDGGTYVIRKQSDDYSQRDGAGYIVKDGKVIRFDAANNTENIGGN